MPKKKLTKAQVKRKINKIIVLYYDMFLDKMGHTNSDVPFGIPKLLEFHKIMNNAAKRMK
jgi:hypothetical protein